MKDPIKELRARLKTYHDAKALYHGPDPYDREEARHRAMCEAQARVGDVALAEALLAAITEAEERGRREALAIAEAFTQGAVARYYADRSTYMDGYSDGADAMNEALRHALRAEVTP